jgi:hypothetical protein
MYDAITIMYNNLNKLVIHNYLSVPTPLLMPRLSSIVIVTSSIKGVLVDELP